MYQIAKNRYWNTWDPKSPTIMEFLPSHFKIAVSAFSTKEDSYTAYPFGRNITLYEHDPLGRYSCLEMEFGGTVLKLEYFKKDDWTVIGKITCSEHGEWALRYWPILSFGFPQKKEENPFNQPVIEHRDRGAHMKRRSYHFGMAVRQKPVKTCITKDAETVGRNMVELGYYTPTPDETDGTWYNMVYNLEMANEIWFSVAVTNSEEQSMTKASEALDFMEKEENLTAIKEGAFRNLLHITDGDFPEAASSICDVMSWNELADSVTERWFVWITRFWNKKFGGWYVWMNDPYYHAFMSALLGDWQMGRASIKATVDNNTPEGNFAGLMSELTEWVDRSQFPINAFMVWKYYLLTGDKVLLDDVYPSVREAHFWWYEYRDGNKNGVLELGSSHVGEGHFGQSKMAAMDESGMDNSPMYDMAEYIDETQTMNMEDVAMNSLLVLDGECLAKMAEVMGDTDTICRLEEMQETHKQKIDEVLWDDSRKIYANRHWEKGFADVSPTSFYPMAAGIPDQEKVQKLLDHMFNPEEFWTPAPFSAISRESAAFSDNVYWRGRLWPPLNFFVYNGLKRYGLDEEAYKVARKSMEVFSSRWLEERACYENYNSMTGQGKDSVDTDFFLSWGALMPSLWIMEHIDVDPWNGFHFGCVKNEDFAVENYRMGDAVYAFTRKGVLTTLRRDKAVIMESDAEGRFRHFVCEEHYRTVEIGKQSRDTWVKFPDVSSIKVKVNDQEISEKETMIPIPRDGAKIEIWY